MVMLLVIALVVGYLLGSLPFGYLVARAKGVNIFEVGSKSSGATNIRRVLGNGPGYLVLALDAAKGAAAAGFSMLYFLWKDSAFGNAPLDSNDANFFAMAALIGALLGHSYSCFTKLKGGKGVATGAGGFAVVFPWGVLIAVAVFALMLALTRYVSLASMIAAATLPVSALLLHQSNLIVGVSAAVAVFVVLRHRGNISRLFAGTEGKIGGKLDATKS
jgi:glycerol-3-phosphate acyltransferase PlsY